jgi:hypothetical protein
MDLQLHFRRWLEFVAPVAVGMDKERPNDQQPDASRAMPSGVVGGETLPGNEEPILDPLMQAILGRTKRKVRKQHKK